MHFTFYLGDSGRIGLNLQFNSDVKSGLRLNVTAVLNRDERPLNVYFGGIVIIPPKVQIRGNLKSGFLIS